MAISKKTDPTKLTVNFERLKKDIQDLSEIGRWEDHGIYRMAFTDEDMQARQWFLDRCKDGGLTPYQDGAANVFGRTNWDEERASVMIGSHLDTVPAGGHLDGALGVMVGLECLRRIHEENLRTAHNLEAVGFADEEGRFGGLFGSQAVCGHMYPERIQSAVDLNGIALTDAMAAHGLDAMAALDARRSPQSLHAYLELHIEQGPVLDQMGYSIGVVEEITGLFKWFVRLVGRADHAGTTPMNMRCDALQGLAEFTGEIPRVLEENGGEDSVATIGKVDLFPGTANTVPGQVEFSLDVRDPDATILAELTNAFRKALSAIARRRDLMFEFDILSEIEPVNCDREIVDTIKRLAKAEDLQFHGMPSGAAHDAQIMADLTRVGMIFVPSKDGRSHSAAEWTHWEDIEIGANLTLQTLIEVAEAGS